MVDIFIEKVSAYTHFHLTGYRKRSLTCSFFFRALFKNDTLHLSCNTVHIYDQRLRAILKAKGKMPSHCLIHGFNFVCFDCA